MDSDQDKQIESIDLNDEKLKDFEEGNVEIASSETLEEKTEENGFDYLSVRLYEASLFLSMLPLHIDNPHKVFGFILNAKNILEEIGKNA